MRYHSFVITNKSSHFDAFAVFTFPMKALIIKEKGGERMSENKLASLGIPSEEYEL